MQVLLQDLFLNSERTVETSREQRTSLDETFSIDVGLPEKVLADQNVQEMIKSTVPNSKEFNPDLLQTTIRPDGPEVILAEELALSEPATQPVPKGQEQPKLQVDWSSAGLGQSEYIDPNRETTPGTTARGSVLPPAESSRQQIQTPQAVDGRWAPLGACPGNGGPGSQVNGQPVSLCPRGNGGPCLSAVRRAI